MKLVAFVPAHKQTDPALKPGQIVTPLGVVVEAPQKPTFAAVKTERKLTFAEWYPLNKQNVGFDYDRARFVWEAAQRNKV